MNKFNLTQFLGVLCGALLSVLCYADSAAYSALADGGRLGIAALDTNTGQQISYNSDQRFPLCSTFKSVAVAAILQDSINNPALLNKNIIYNQQAVDKTR